MTTGTSGVGLDGTPLLISDTGYLVDSHCVVLLNSLSEVV